MSGMPVRRTTAMFIDIYICIYRIVLYYTCVCMGVCANFSGNRFDFNFFTCFLMNSSYTSFALFSISQRFKMVLLKLTQN